MSSAIHAIPGNLDAAEYSRHAVHSSTSAWLEKNCYIDVWLELLHALGCEPLAIMPFVFTMDYEHDQWTFYKPPHSELWSLYGVDVQELNVWRPLIDQAQTHLAAGKLISSEADAYYLPDTQGTDYRKQHTKSTIIINAVDLDRKRMGYFHNAGYFELEGEDFDALFRIGAPADPSFMPLYAELIRIDRLRRRPVEELAEMSLALLARHLERRPVENPIRRFGANLSAELDGLHELGIDQYHAWAFAHTRQLGSGFELAASYLRWLQPQVETDLSALATDCDTICDSSKSLILKGARAVARRKAIDANEMFEAMASSWDRIIDGLLRLSSER